MNVTLSTTTKRLIASVSLAAAGAAVPALLSVGVGTAHADACYGELQYSYYCSPASGAQSGSAVSDPFYGPPSTNLWPALPGCTGGVLAALGGSC
jgi:hypothetical protein